MVAVDSAEQALQALHDDGADILVSDIGLPGVDGYALLQQVRFAGHRLPAIALTAFARPEDKTRTLKAGYSLHMAKPVEPDELVASVRSLLDHAVSLPGAG